MKKHVLFIQGGGEGAYDADAKLAASLQRALGADYEVIYPKMPGEDDPKYAAWKAQIEQSAAGHNKLIYVAHSMGTVALLKYLAEANVQNAAAIFLIAALYWDAAEHEGDEFTLSEGFASKLPAGTPIHFYHSRDDEEIPFSHLALYRQKLPEATYHEVDEGGHQFNNDLSIVAADIAKLP